MNPVLYVKYVSVSLLFSALGALLLLSGCGGSKRAQSGGGRLKSEKSQKISAFFIDAATKQAQQYPDEAIKLYEEVLKLDSDHAASLYNIARILFDQEKYAEALPYATKALKQDDSNLWYYTLLAEVYQKNKRLGDATRTMERAVAKFPDEMDLRLKLAGYYLGQKQFEEALAQYDYLEKHAGLNEAIVRQKKEIYLFINQPDQAIAEIRKLIERMPENTRFYYELYEVYRKLDRQQEALDLMRELAAEHPDDAFATFRMMEHYRQTGQNEKADSLMQDAFNNPAVPVETKVQFVYRILGNYPSGIEEGGRFAEGLVRRHPDNGKVLALRGYVYALEEKADSCRYYYRRAVDYDETNQQLWEQLLARDYELGMYDSLAADSEDAMVIFPNQAQFMYFNGLAHYQLRNYQKATRMLEKYTKYAELDAAMVAEVYTLLGDAYHYLKDYRQSDRYYNKALEKQPDNFTALNNYAYFLSLRNERLDTALKMIEKVIEAQPNNPSYQDTYGWILYKLQRFEEAVTWLEKAYQASGGGAVAEHLGDAYYQLGDLDKAREYWQKALEMGEDNEELRKKISTGKL